MRIVHLLVLCLLSFLLSGCGTATRQPMIQTIERPLPPRPQTFRTPTTPPSNEAKQIAVNDAFQAKKRKSVIVIDPGHGGDDFGTHSTTKPKYQEKSLNLSTAILLKGYLEQLGYKIIMTRKNDVFIPLEKRAEFANNLTPTLFVSVHYNSAPSKDAEGIEVFYYQKDEDKQRVKQSKQLADSVLSNLLTLTKAKSRGVKHGNFAVIRQTKMPAILVEGGFLTNDSEMEKIKDPAYMKQVAWGIAKGIDEYLNKIGG